MADLRALLGAAALPCPQLDIGPACAAAVVAALGTQKAKDIPFSPYENDLFFLHGMHLQQATFTQAWHIPHDLHVPAIPMLGHM